MVLHCHKLKVVEFAKKSNIFSAGRYFDDFEKLVRNWRKAESILRNMPKKSALKTGKISWPELEDGIFQRVIQKHQNLFRLSYLNVFTSISKTT